MSRQKWILILTVFMAVAQKIHAACVCNEKGENACASCTEIVRPKPNHPERPEIALPPIGDNCWCRKSSIEPASLPKPCSEPSIQPPTCDCSAQSLPNSCVVSQANYVHQDDSPPADPISVSLAVQAGKAIEVPEAKLAYGFVRKPINGLPKVYVSAVKEENLYALANDIITLKKPLAANRQTLEEDYPEEEESAPGDYEPPSSLTYKQLGYETEQFQNPQFIPIPAFAGAGQVLVQNAVETNCGFRPGRIAKANSRKCGSNASSVKR